MTQLEIIPIVGLKDIAGKNSRWYIDKGHCDHELSTQWFDDKYVTILDGVGGRLEFTRQVRECTNCGLPEERLLITSDTEQQKELYDR